MMPDKHRTEFTEQRLDKWLWVARFFKSRTLAADAVTGGKVQCNGERSKPGRTVKPGDRLIVRKGIYEFEITIEQLSRQRLPAPAAQDLYKETESSAQQREIRMEQARVERLSMPISEKRPTKRDRRILLATKHRQRD
jgi:ribosome-associated heat shock protein Hsp15